MTTTIKRLAIIGSGAMGSAIAKGVISAGVLNPSDVTLVDIDADRLKTLAGVLGVSTASSNIDAVRGADVVLLAVKPAVVACVLDEISEVVDESKLIVSIAAGVKLATMQSHLHEGSAVIRAMPNTPSMVGSGATAFARGRKVTDAQASVAKRLFDAVGVSFEVQEKNLDAVTGLSGSGPAYVYLMIEALSDAGVRVGLTRDVSTKLAAQTVMGAAKMVLETGEHPGQLKDKVTSPGGTTIAGVDALERAGFRSALIEAVKAATKRSEELG